MTPEELSVLYNAGRSLRLDSFTIFTKAALYGVFLVLNGLTIFQLFHRGTISRSTKFLVFMIFILFLSTTIEVARSLAILVINIETIVMGYRVSDPILDERQKVASQTLRPILALSSWTTTINFLCGDIIVVWRALQLYQRPSARHTLLAFIIIDGCLSFCSGVLLTRSYVIHDITGVEMVPDPLEKRYDLGVNLTSYWWSLITNMYATALIAMKARRHLRNTRRVGVKSSVGPVLVLFVETGFAFCALQMIYNILWQIALPPFNVALDAFNVFVLFTSAIYPASIILILKHRISVIDNSTTFYTYSDTAPSSTRHDASDPIQFAHSDTKGSIGLRVLTGGKDSSDSPTVHDDLMDAESVVSPGASGSWKLR